MAQKKSKNTSKKTDSKGSTSKTKPELKPQPVRREVAAGVFGFAALLIGVGMFSQDGFVVGALCELLKGLFGYGFWVTAPIFVLCAVILGFHRGRPVTFRLVSALLLPLIIAAVLDITLSKVVVENLGGVFKAFGALYAGGKAMTCGGVLGALLSFGFQKAFSFYGAAIILILLFVFFTLAAFNVTMRKIADRAKDRETLEYEPEPEVIKPLGKKPGKKQPEPEEKAEPKVSKPVKEKKRSSIDIPLDDEPLIKPAELPDEETVIEEKHSLRFGRKNKKRDASEKAEQSAEAKSLPLIETGEMSDVVLEGSGATEAAVISDPPRKLSRSELAAETAAVAIEIEQEEAGEEYEKPPIYLLKKGHATANNDEDEVALNRERLESAVMSFGVSAHVVDTTHGPTVTRYDLELEQGVKLNRLTNLAGDIALALGVVSVRIAPIPEKISTVGIEVPNKLISTVYLRDIIDSPKFLNAKSSLSFAVGKDIGGEAIVGNISKLPHLLIAGTTGSGKSVCMNSLIISLLYKSSPEDVRLIMIDPKMVELGVYNGIPHLFIPVVTDPKKAAGALQWTVTEMLKRYRLFSEIGVRNLEAYNEYLQKNGQTKVPNVVVVVDELADLMLVASKDVEECICRVAQMGRAAGIHLIIATQRPSADVITGLMKANIPSRIAFAVSSAMESRIILDTSGAEKLIGMGDMLYAPIGCGKPIRVQGAFVSDEEREAIVGFIKEHGESDYSDDIMAHIEKAAEEKSSGAKQSAEDDGDEGSAMFDELLPQAVDVILETKQASVSMLQRRLKLGYSRAARIVDQMEELGIVGPFEGSKPRQLLITRDQWLEMQTTHGTAPTEILKTNITFADEFDSDE